MQIEKEDSNKIRIILKPIDLQEMNVNIESLKPNSPRLHSFLYEIMERVREETGFNPYLGQIIVEASPMGEGMELTVTRVSHQKNPPVPANAKIRRVKAVRNTSSPKRTAFIFECCDDFCNALIHITPDTLQKSSYYKLCKNDILIVKDISLQEKNILREYSVSSKSGGVVEPYANEHGNLIASGNKLVSMAKGISQL